MDPVKAEHAKKQVELAHKLIQFIADNSEGCHPDVVNCALLSTFHFFASNYIRWEGKESPGCERKMAEHYRGAMKRIYDQLLLPPPWIPKARNN